MTSLPVSPLRSDGVPRLPPLWVGQRRRDLCVLVLTGLGQASAAGFAAHFLIRGLGGTTSGHLFLLIGVLALSALCVGALRMAERVVSEKVSQDYVHELRLGLVRRHLSERQGSNLGVAVARTTNDLGSVRNWVTDGIVPLAVGVPFLLGATAVLALIDPVLALSLVGPGLFLAVALRLVIPTAYRRSRALRRVRGRLAGQVADIILASAAVRSAGGTGRELRRVDRLSAALASSAVQRARTAGALRGAAAATSGLMTASTIAVGVAAHLPQAHLAAALAINGLLATPIHDLGRVAEFRQTYLAARHVIGPVLGSQAGAAEGLVTEAAVNEHAIPVIASAAPTFRPGTLVLRDLTVAGISMPDLVAQPGDRVLVRTGHADRDTELLHRLVALADIDPGQVSVGAVDLAGAAPSTTRALVGYGSQGMTLPRSSIARAVAYRVSGTPGSDVDDLLRRVGLYDRVQALPDGSSTMLRQGGKPLTTQERGQLILARAIYRDPPLVVLDHLDADLGRKGRKILRDVLRSYPGVVVLASDLTDDAVVPTQTWTPQRQHPQDSPDPHRTGAMAGVSQHRRTTLSPQRTAPISRLS